MRGNWAARAVGEVTEEDLGRFDVFMFVKVPDADLLERVLVRGRIAVHDVVDWWRQPWDHRRVKNQQQSRELFVSRWRKLPPFHGHIFACRAMYDDLAPLSPFPGMIYHHYRPDITPEKLRSGRLTVGYEGKEKYLGQWRDTIVELCTKHDMAFVAERIRTQPIDIGFAARGARFGGYLPDNYKSNVKLANCYGAGVPAIMPAVQAAYRETATEGVAWFEKPADIDRALTGLEDKETRRRMGRLNLQAASGFTVAAMADRYEFFLQRLKVFHKSGLID